MNYTMTLASLTTAMKYIHGLENGTTYSSLGDGMFCISDCVNGTNSKTSDWDIDTIIRMLQNKF